jgi:hypothetical protein
MLESRIKEPTEQVKAIEEILATADDRWLPTITDFESKKRWVELMDTVVTLGVDEVGEKTIEVQCRFGESLLHHNIGCGSDA